MDTPAPAAAQSESHVPRVAPHQHTSAVAFRPSFRVAPPFGSMLLTFKEAMAFLRVSRSTIYRLMWAGQLRGYKVGSSWRFYEADLLDAVASPTLGPAEGRGSRIYEGGSGDHR